MNTAGGHDPSIGVLPPQQGFEANDRIGFYERLVFEEELPFLQGDTQTTPKHLALFQHDEHRAIEASGSPAPIVLGGIKSDVRSLHQLLAIVSVLERDRDPDARSDEHIDAFDGERLFESIHDRLGETFGLHRRATTLDDGKFITGKPISDVSFAKHGLKSLGGTLKYEVTGSMPERIVDGFEVVEIDLHQRNSFHALDWKTGVQVVAKLPAIR